MHALSIDELGAPSEPARSGQLPGALMDLADGRLDRIRAEALIEWLHASDVVQPPARMVHRALRIATRRPPGRRVGPRAAVAARACRCCGSQRSGVGLLCAPCTRWYRLYVWARYRAAGFPHGRALRGCLRWRHEQPRRGVLLFEQFLAQGRDPVTPPPESSGMEGLHVGPTGRGDREAGTAANSAAAILLPMRSQADAAPRRRARPRLRGLIAACLRGEQEAWEFLVRSRAGLVYAAVRGFGCDGDEAADLFHEVWLTAWGELDTVRDEAEVDVWLTTLAARCARQVSRMRRPPVGTGDEATARVVRRP